MIDRIRTYILDMKMISPGGKLVAGISGGADSVCLFHVLRELQEALSFSFSVVHVEHGIRGEEALADAAFVEGLCAEAGIPCRVVHVDVPALAARAGVGLEEAGRLARRQAFEEARRELGADIIALAHHMDDRAETFLFNAARGTGLAGLGSIRPVSGVYVRPLLCVSREEITAFLRARGALWREDSTNAETDYTRNRLRLEVIPALREGVNSRASEHMARTAELVAEAWDYLSLVAEDRYRRFGRREEGRVVLAASLVEEEPPIIAGGVIRLALAELRGGGKDLTARHIEAVRDLFRGRNGRTADLPGGIRARRVPEGVVISRPDRAEIPEETGLLVPGITRFGDWVFETVLVGPETWEENKKLAFCPGQNQCTKWFDYDKIKDTARIRCRRAGDFIVIHPDGRRRSISDLFTDRKVPAEDRDRVPLLADGSDILWAVGIRSGEGRRIGSGTRRILMVKAEKAGGEESGQGVENE